MSDTIPLPSDILTERLVLGCCLMDPELMANCRMVLSPDEFSIERHRRIWKHACRIYDEGGKADRVTVAYALKEAREDEQNTLSYLISLDEGLPQLPNLDSYIGILREESMRRRIMAIGDSISKRAALRTERPESILNEMAAKAVDMVQADPRRGLITARELVDRHGLAEILAPRIKFGLPFPWSWMTASTCGMLPGELWVLAAHTSCGKTSAALQTAVRAAQKGKRAVIFSLEMGAVSLFQRATWQLSGVDSERAKRGRLAKQERDAVNDAATCLYDLPILFSQKSSVTAIEIRSELRREAARGPLGLVVVDYLQLLSDGGRHDKRSDAVGAAARACKLMAGEFECPVLLLSQFNRESAKPDKLRKPVLTDLKESGDIENHANGIWFIHRESLLDADQVTVQFILAKQREGRRNIDREFWFLPSVQRFDEKEVYRDDE